MFRITLCLFAAAVASFCCGSEPSQRPWTTSRLSGAPDPPPPYRVERVYPGLEFDRPVAVVPLPGRNLRLVLQHDGQLLSFSPYQPPDDPTVIGDLREFEPDLAAGLDVCPDPEFESNGRIYVAWNARPQLREDGARVVRFRLSDSNPPSLIPESRLDIFTWPSGGHTGCAIRFGPDAMMYVSMGDGAGAFPPDEYRTAQDLSDVRGSILRLDVKNATADQPYRVPPDNPFADVADARGEIFAFGLRNPWRMHFDPKDGTLFVGDVGWELWEMIHRVDAGANYGWSITEGPQPVHSDESSGPGPIVAPEVALSHTESQSITGGVIVREASPASLRGHYLFGDYVSGSIWSARVVDGHLGEHRKIAVTPLAIISFALFDVTDDGIDDVIVLDHGGGIYRLVPNDAEDTSNQFPRRLSETGLFTTIDPIVPSDGVYPFAPAATMWRDGAVGRRHLAVPDDGQIKAVKNRRQWSFPTGTVLANTISRDVVDGTKLRTRPIETQILLYDGISWQPYTYRWRKNGQDADLVEAGGDSVALRVRDPYLGQRDYLHRFASRDQCRVCHHQKVPGGISLTPENLARPSHHTSGLSQWEFLGDRVVVQGTAGMGTELVDPYDERSSLDARARSYLDANCAHCHQRGGGGSAAVVLSHSQPPLKMNAIGVAAGQGSFGIPAAHPGGAASVIEPGVPSHSVLYYRVSTLLSGRMPHLGAQEVDLKGVRLIYDWIESLEADGDQDRTHVSISRASSNPVPGTPGILTQQRACLELPRRQRVAMAKRQLAENPSAIARGVWEAFVSPEDRSPRIGQDPDPRYLLSLQGDAELGRRWFAASDSSQCRSCHVAEGIGKHVGPQLDGIASRLSRTKLVESLVNPSEKIDETWATYSVLTTDGRQIVGIKVDETDKRVLLRSTDGSDHAIARDDIQQMARQRKSIMPDGQVPTMTETEFANLLAYLQSLR